MPFIISVLPLLGLEILENEWIEYATIILSFIIAAIALFHGYNSHHQKLLPLVIVSLGFGCIALGHLIFEEGHFLEVIFTVAGALSVAASHVVNWKLIGKAKEIQARSAVQPSEAHCS